MDWCCFPHLDSESVFAAILDGRKGGRFRVSLAGAGMGRQHYQRDTNVLVTEFTSDQGALTVTDFMPLSGNIETLNSSSARPEIHRILAFDGRGEIEVEWSPRFDYARSATRIRRLENGWLAGDGNGRRLCLAGLREGDVAETEYGPELRARIRMNGRDRRVLVTRWDSDNTSFDLDDSLQKQNEAAGLWSAWPTRRSHSQPRLDRRDATTRVIRSELALKLLTHAETGAIAAAGDHVASETIGACETGTHR